MNNIYDLIIIGAGPAGLTAAIYAAKANLKVAIIEKNAPGGKLVNINKITNFPTENEILGTDLAIKMFNHALNCGIEYIDETVIDIMPNQIKTIKASRHTFLAKSIIIATGTKEKKANIEGEDFFFGKGVSYCAVCDAPLYKGKDVAVIGDYDVALNEALYLSSFAKKIYLISTKNKYSNNELLNKVLDNGNIKIIYNASISKIEGDEEVKGIVLNDKLLNVSAVFIFMGLTPSTNFATRLGITNEKGYIIVNSKMETKIAGMYAAGDVIEKELRQIVTANSDGAIAANQVIKYLNK